MAALFINIFAFVFLMWALIKDKQKTKKAVLIALKSFLRMLPVMLAIIIIIGLMLGFVPQNKISSLIGNKAGFFGTLFVAVIGAFMHIPSIISFPLAASLITKGASVSSVAVFITSLTMIGMVTLPLEIKELGKQLALLRNILSFIIAILIGIIMGVLL